MKIESYALNQEISSEQELQNYLEDTGLKTVNLNPVNSLQFWDREDSEKVEFGENFYQWLVKNNFIEEVRHDHEKIRAASKYITKKGMPDIIVENNEEFYFIEVKKLGDAIRESQIKWIRENKEFKVIIYYL